MWELFFLTYLNNTCGVLVKKKKILQRLFSHIWLVNSGDVLGRNEMLPTCGMTVLWESLNTKSEQCTSRLLKFAAHRNPGRCEERSRTRCGGAVPSAAHPYTHFRIRELISPGAGSLGRRWHSAEPRSGNYLQLRRDVSPKVMFPLWGWLPPMTTRCRGKNP